MRGTAGGGRWRASGGSQSEFKLSTLPNGEVITTVIGDSTNRSRSQRRWSLASTSSSIDSTQNDDSEASDEEEEEAKTTSGHKNELLSTYKSTTSKFLRSTFQADYTPPHLKYFTKRSLVASMPNPRDTLPNGQMSMGRRFELIGPRRKMSTSISPQLTTQLLQTTLKPASRSSKTLYSTTTTHSSFQLPKVNKQDTTPRLFRSFQSTNLTWSQQY